MTQIYIPTGITEPRRDWEIPKYRAELPKKLPKNQGEPNLYHFHIPTGILEARMSAKELAMILGPHLVAVLPFMAPDYLMLPTDRGYDKMTSKKLSDDQIALRYKIFGLHFSIYEEYRAMLIRFQTWPDNAIDDLQNWIRPLARKSKTQPDDIIELNMYPAHDYAKRTHTIFYGLYGSVICSAPPVKQKSGLIFPHNIKEDPLVTRAEKRFTNAQLKRSDDYMVSSKSVTTPSVN